MAKYQRKTITVEAFQWNGFDEKTNPKWFVDAQSKAPDTPGSVRVISNDIVKILTIDGIMTAYKRDYIIKAGNEIYPCNAQVFHLLHAEVTK